MINPSIADGFNKQESFVLWIMDRTKRSHKLIYKTIKGQVIIYKKKNNFKRIVKEKKYNKCPNKYNFFYILE